MDIKCKSNLKQLMTAQLLYENDFGRFTPFYNEYASATPPENMIWHERLDYYMPLEDVSGGGFAGTSNQSAYNCPKKESEVAHLGQQDLRTEQLHVQRQVEGFP